MTNEVAVQMTVYKDCGNQAFWPSSQATCSKHQTFESLRKMHFLSVVALTASFAASVAAAPAPAITPAPQPDAVAKRATSCTFSGSAGAAAASKSQASCATIVLNNVAVPSGTTLDLSKLADDTTVIFQGTTTWGYKEWAGPLLSIGGKKITVQGASGAVLNPDGARWWDGLGGNGGK